MSRIEVTDLAPGEAATAAGVNATINSWNTGTAAGSITADNVNMEGIDRRTLSTTQHMVYTTASGTTTYVQAAPVIVNVVGPFAVIPGPFATDTLSFATDQQVIVHASVWVDVDDTNVNQNVALIMQVSTNGGAWVDMVGTLQSFQQRNVYAAGPPAGFTDVATPYPGIKQAATWSVYFTAAAGSTLQFRIAYTISTALVVATFSQGTIFTETFNF